jgi:hypothetical protein
VSVIPAEVVPAAFAAAAAELEGFAWSPDIEVSALQPPRRIAPYTAAIIAEIGQDDVIDGSGKLILLYDPAGQAAWQGDFRCVTYATAAIDQETVHDQLRAEVGWSWLIDALDNHNAAWRAAGGTVTVSSSTHFGELADEPSTADIELRASWTPNLPGGVGLGAHLTAWQDLLRMVTGRPPEVAGVIPLSRVGRR